MPWSGLRARFKSFIVPALRDRIDFHVTGYRNAYEQRGKGWITVDGKLLVTFCDFVHENAWRAESQANGKGPWNIEAHDTIQSRHILPDHSIGEAMRFVMNHPVGDSLASDNPLIVALAAIDRRTGRRTMLQINMKRLPDWAQVLVELRRAACTTQS